ncbi:redoxin domain-containing protein [bacterium]|nr:MAG: redoxin domain-containing protein [bacterium]
MRQSWFLGFVTLALAFALPSSWAAGSAATEALAPGSSAPSLAYRLIDGKTLTPSELRGHPYVLWLMATWCSSCQGGTAVVAQHIGELRARGVYVVQVEVAHDLGYPGPPLASFQKAVGMAAAAPNWYWGQLTEAQMRQLDPHAYPDIYYLVDAQGQIVAVDGAPAATWSRIARFAGAAPTAR